MIIENSKLLEALGLHERQSMGLVDYGTYRQTHTNPGETK